MLGTHFLFIPHAKDVILKEILLTRPYSEIYEKTIINKKNKESINISVNYDDNIKLIIIMER